MSFRIDWKKWDDAVKAALASREIQPKLCADYKAGIIDYKAFRDAGGRWGDPLTEELTKLYSIRAMAHDRVHRNRARLTHSQARGLGMDCDSLPFIDAGGTLVFDLTPEHQQKFVGSDYKQFERQEPVPVIVTEMVTTSTSG